MLACPKAQIAGAMNGLEALQAMQQGAFDWVFMGMLMPQKDAILASQHIRAEKVFTQAPAKTC